MQKWPEGPKIWTSAQTPEKRGFGNLLLVLLYCDSGEFSAGTFHSEKRRERHKVQHHKANSPTSIEHSKETVLRRCEQLSFGINQAAAYFGGESGLYFCILRHLQCWTRKGVKDIKHCAQLKLLSKPQQNINVLCTANLEKKNAYFLNPLFLAPLTLIQTQSVSMRILLYLNHVWKHGKLQFRH